MSPQPGHRPALDYRDSAVIYHADPLWVNKLYTVTVLDNFTVQM